MIELRIGPHPGASDAARARFRTAHICICAISLTLCLSSRASAEVRPNASGPLARPTLSSAFTMTQLPITGATMTTQTAANPKSTLTAGSEDAIRPFRVSIPEKDIVDLRRRIAATRWPTGELVKDRSQGVQLATLRARARYWGTDYDWRKA